MTMKISLIVLSIALLLITPGTANGCTCMNYPTICDSYTRVENVFIGYYSGNTSCDVEYKEGQRWLFYTTFDKESQTWRIGFCGRSRLIEQAADDLLYLQALPA